MNNYRRIGKEIKKLKSIEVGNINISGLLPFSIKTQNILIKMGIDDIEKLNTTTNIEIIKMVRGVGKKTLAEIESYFSCGNVYHGVQAEISKRRSELAHEIKYLYKLKDDIDFLILRLYHRLDELDR